MIYHAKKFICYTTSIALLTSSLTPVYAGPSHHNSAQEDLSIEDHSRPRTLVPKDVLQEKAKASGKGQTWTPDFIKNITSYAYSKMSSLFESSESDFSYDLTSLKEYFAENFAEEIEDIKTSKPNRRRLKDLQIIVWRGELSPYQYEEGLKELKSHASEALLKRVQDQFQQKLKSYPAFLNGNFQRDLVTYLEDTRTEGNHFSEKGIKDFEDLLTYYRHLQNPLDYTNTLVDLRRFIQKNKQLLDLSDHQYGAFNRAITKAVKQRDEKQYSALKANSRFVQSALQELPYNGEDIPEGFNSSLPSVAKKAAVQRDYLSEPFSFMTPIKGLAHGVYKGMKYVIEHPGQAITIGLASQIAASAALNPQLSSPLVSRYTKRASGDEFQINQNTTTGELAPSVASLTNGNVFVVWMGYQSGNNDIYGRVFSANGAALNNEFIINQNTSSSQFFPSVASLTNGNAFVVWQGAQTGNLDIYGRLFSANGAVLSNDFRINQDTFAHQFKPFVASLTNGNAFVVWEGDQTGNSDIYGRIFSADGMPLGNEFGITQNTGGEGYPSVAGLNNGNAFVTWRMGYQSGNSDIYGRMFTANGTAISNDFIINQNTMDEGYSSVASLTGGNAFVGWTHYRAGASDIYGRIFSANGAAIDNQFTINQVTTTDQNFPSVTSLTNGNAFVVWEGEQTGNDDIYGRIFSANGTALNDAFNINQVTTADQILPTVTGLNNGNAFVAWAGDQVGNLNIYGRIFSADGTPTSTSGSSSTMTMGSSTTSTTSPQTSTAGLTSTGAATTAVPATGSSTTNFLTSATSNSTTGEDITSSTDSSTSQGITTGISSTTGASITSSTTSTTSISTTDGDVSSSHRLTPSWLVSPVRAIANGFKSLWNMSKNVE